MIILCLTEHSQEGSLLEHMSGAGMPSSTYEVHKC